MASQPPDQQPVRREIPELRLGPIESQADIELALRELQARINELIRAVNSRVL